MKTFPFYRQVDTMDCGPSCLRMIAKFYGYQLNLNKLRTSSQVGVHGSSLLGLSKAAESCGFKTIAARVTLEQLTTQVPLPCIVHWEQKHFVVVHAVGESRSAWLRKFRAGKSTAEGSALRLQVADPGLGLVSYSAAEFLKAWGGEQAEVHGGVCLILEPTAALAAPDEQEQRSKYGLRHVLKQLTDARKLVVQLLLGLLVGSSVQFIFPFLTQSLVDIGIATKDYGIVYTILLAQGLLLIGRLVNDFVRGWILLHISTRINLRILSDFIIKLMSLPVSYFERKTFGDIMQRINDHGRIEQFLTNQSLNILFSFLQLVVFGGVILIYSRVIFIVFFVLSLIYILWTAYLLKKRKVLDAERFQLASKSQNAINQIIQGIHDIKLANAEQPMRWVWERVQAKNLRLQYKVLSLSQLQQTGAFILNEGRNLSISFLAAKAVIDNQMTLGMMLAMQYIIGQLTGPIEMLVMFIQTYQDASLSLERLSEVHELDEEDKWTDAQVGQVHAGQSLHLRNVTFAYPNTPTKPVLRNIDLHIPAGKITAVVGSSGSGKSSLLKLLMKTYEPLEGSIHLSNTNLKHLTHSSWRSKCAVVAQEGFIFSDTVAGNIAVGDETPDLTKLLYAARMANILEFIETLPRGFSTKIGSDGQQVSQGQKQRILIARAIYKEPEFLFFDEATNALDTENESIIVQNLSNFFDNRTVVIVAHRLSTVRYADQIVVMENGQISEQGSHEELLQQCGTYWNLVRNQVELVG
ncbi:peptidase domain-containing ABC transporter [Hymenobacter sp. 15J16-1T3B]|uniref:peptidase domain-containing ABC transporter n=1 Tax=Hymenobacter sp. 15J16-1T3B TaxID=2886941 RepID=UPI001D127D81|nr:peptidase domain-containing ABC transporter [Hymenobacter sp. 15J16-1T3B]MCC3157468.1 peptidase domain-containing ABC transporter [Hymenobacter sp. 15J16-1T3B]